MFFRKRPKTRVFEAILGRFIIPDSSKRDDQIRRSKQKKGPSNGSRLFGRLQPPVFAASAYGIAIVLESFTKIGWGQHCVFKAKSGLMILTD